MEPAQRDSLERSVLTRALDVPNNVISLIAVGSR